MPGWNPLDLRQHIVVCGIRCYRLIPYDNVLPKSQVAMKGNDNQKNRLEKKNRSSLSAVNGISKLS